MNKKEENEKKNPMYLKGYQEGVKETIKKLFTLDVITIEKIAEVTGLTINEIEEITKK